MALGETVSPVASPPAANPGQAQPVSGRQDNLPLVLTRGCHEYIREDYIRALYPYPLRIRAEDAYPKCIMRTGGEDISILTDRKCEIISDPYPRKEIQDTGIYMVMKVLAYDEFCLSAVVLSYCVPPIGGEMSEHLAAASGDPARPG